MKVEGIWPSHCLVIDQQKIIAVTTPKVIVQPKATSHDCNLLAPLFVVHCFDLSAH